MTDKVTLSNITTFTNDTSAAATYTANNEAIVAAFDNTLSLNGQAPNQMQSNLDMNSYTIINLPLASTPSSPVVLSQLGGSVSGVGGLPSGGTASQYLVKNSSTNYDTKWVNPAIFTRTAPTQQIFTSGTGTYTTPANCLYIVVRMVGGGGGGGGAGSGAGTGGTGGTTTFGTSFLTCTGGAGGAGNNGATAGGAGGTATGGDFNFVGQQGCGAGGVLSGGTASGSGGSSAFFSGGGAGQSGTAVPGTAAVVNTGSGGGGSANGGTYSGGCGGGGGGSLEKLITSPSSTYAYAVGAGGASGTSGASSYGGPGSAGIIIVREFYN